MEKNKFSVKKYLSLWPECLVLLLCAVLLSLGISGKKGYHMDELLSFELANAEFNPWIVPTQPQGRLAKFVEREIRGDSAAQTFGNLWNVAVDVLKNRGGSKLLSYQADVYPEPVWISRETFTEYVTVNRLDDFNYLSVYFNVKDDNHPPLHFMLLHTVSSLFKEKLSPVMGCAINLCFVLGIMILLMRIGRICMTLMGCGEWGRLAGLAAAAVYGVSAGALSTTLLIRMYAMVTFFCTWLLYLHLEKLYHERLFGEGLLRTDAGFDKKNKLLILATLLGFWTQYFFLFYCLTIAGVTAWILWRRKRTKELLHYVVSMVTAAVIGLLAFPFAVSDVFASGRGVEALGNLGSGLGDLGIRLKAFLEILGTAVGMPCIFVLLLINFSWGYLRLRGVKLEKGLLAVLLIPVIAYFLLAAKLSPFLVDRYVMPVFPLVTLLLVVGACGCLASLLREKIKKMTLLLTVLMGALILTQPFMPGHTDNAYLYPEYAEQEEIAKEYAGIPCICVYEGVGYYENLPEFMQYEKTLLVTLPELQGREERDSIEALDQVAVLMKNKAWAKDVESVMKTYGLKPEAVAYETASEGGDYLLIYGKDQD